MLNRIKMSWRMADNLGKITMVGLLLVDIICVVLVVQHVFFC